MRRRRFQSAAIGFVVLIATTAVLMTLALLVAASAPFDQAFARQRGAHAVVTFDAAKVTDEQVARTATRAGVEDTAGPFGQAVLDVTKDWYQQAAGPLTVVGRADPGGPVDRVDIRIGRWATAPGEIVVNFADQGTPDPDLLGAEVVAEGARPFTVVGFATSMSQSAGAWVTPEQMTALRPQARQMLYRFTSASTDQQIRAGLAEAGQGLPAGVTTTVQSYLALKLAFSNVAGAYLPLLTVFGVLALGVCVLIVVNVVSGAVVSGYRHIGVLKALGFTPNQVMAVYLMMIGVPAVGGCVLGTLSGIMLAPPILTVAFSGVQAGNAVVGVSPWVSVACPPAMCALVALAALVPALRARRLPAAQAISAGSAPKAGRGLRTQRWLAAAPLPRSVSLGLGLPFARPGRTALTAAAVMLGVATATLATGASSTMIAAGNLGRTGGAVINVQVGGRPETGRPAPKLSDPRIEARLRALPGAKGVTARAFVQVQLAGYTLSRFANFYRGDRPPAFLSQIVEGRWPKGPREIVAGPRFLTQHGLRVGDRVTLRRDGRHVSAIIVGSLVDSDSRTVGATWPTAAELAPDAKPAEYYVQLAPDADPQAYMDAVRAADAGLNPSLVSSGSFATTAVVGMSSVFTALLAIVAALGVFNTVLLNVRERRRDLGILKAIGMTPRQVTVMTVTSAAWPGAVGGLLGIPFGMVAHRLLVDSVTVVVFPEPMKDVWHAPYLAALALTGIVIAVLGALIPARSAARSTVLRNE
ncbi:ABC transporter permease [Nonomuraea rosea]